MFHNYIPKQQKTTSQVWPTNIPTPLTNFAPFNKPLRRHDFQVVVFRQLCRCDGQGGRPMQLDVLGETDEDRLLVEDALTIIDHLGRSERWKLFVGKSYS